VTGSWSTPLRKVAVERCLGVSCNTRATSGAKRVQSGRPAVPQGHSGPTSGNHEAAGQTGSDLRLCAWAGAGSNRRPSTFQAEGIRRSEGQFGHSCALRATSLRGHRPGKLRGVSVLGEGLVPPADRTQVAASRPLGRPAADGCLATPAVHGLRVPAAHKAELITLMGTCSSGARCSRRLRSWVSRDLDRDVGCLLATAGRIQ
jgi:hypothetical protein